jgi:uncharacterized protein YbgA (DUF1722 family)
VLQFGVDEGVSLTSPISLIPGKSWRVHFEKDFLKKEKFFERTGETPRVTVGLRTGYNKKF